jgi:hypothetical protein
VWYTRYRYCIIILSYYFVRHCANSVCTHSWSCMNMQCVESWICSVGCSQVSFYWIGPPELHTSEVCTTDCERAKFFAQINLFFSSFFWPACCAPLEIYSNAQLQTIQKTSSFYRICFFSHSRVHFSKITCVRATFSGNVSRKWMRLKGQYHKILSFWTLQ